MSSTSSGIPFMELYRPKNLESIVLDPLNKKILMNIIETSYFPNLLFHGPPGTGKTTTIINLINAYQDKNEKRNKDLIIHLNASDERGIDIIRNQINYFANSKPLFNDGIKFVILDEVDYMTKNAQQALRYLLQNYTSNVRFCLICNYISKIDEGLQNEFVKIRFNQLPKNEIIKFIKTISINENLNLTDETLTSIQKLYSSDIRSMINFIKTISINENLNLTDETLTSIQKLYSSDIRSMINFIQTNQNLKNDCFKIINNEIWEQLLAKMKGKIDEIMDFINNISIHYNIDKKNIIKDFLNYIIRNQPNYLKSDFLYIIENLVHKQSPTQINISIYYLIYKLKPFISLNHL
jgi:replication factor C subunit 3/5